MRAFFERDMISIWRRFLEGFQMTTPAEGCLSPWWKKMVTYISIPARMQPKSSMAEICTSTSSGPMMVLEPPLVGKQRELQGYEITLGVSLNLNCKNF